ncbi:hypothetical protein D4764_0104390 [Takifugu flavidus]|uniref:Uncharacterized protein n=1 Tax=Takifugu flavidus TaxID=433684 RepID=A0A5C6MIF8_9TELE|nr:hypothetical protein D4764_0104390 [Takifugu flavidus]
MAGVASVPIVNNKDFRVMGGRLGGRTVLSLSRMGGRVIGGSSLSRDVQNSPGHFLQLFGEYSEVLPGQLEDIVSPASPSWP